MNHVDAVQAQVFLDGVVSKCLVDGIIKLDREQQTDALNPDDAAVQLVGQLFEFFNKLAAALNNVGAQLGRDLLKHGGADIQRSRVGGHGVAVNAFLVKVGRAIVHGQNRQRIDRKSTRLNSSHVAI